MADAHHDELGGHISPLQTYLAVFGALLLFTGLTYAVSLADLGPFAFPIAMAVAFCKAFLVASFFMHLKYDERFNLVVFVSSLFFVSVFAFFTIIDVTGRGQLRPAEGYYVWQEEQAANAAMEAAAAEDEADSAEAEETADN
jgi:cytochrome c oxidase subunit 4